MSVTFNRTQLITVVHKALGEHEKAEKRYGMLIDKYLADQAAKHVRECRSKMTGLRDALTKALRGNQMLTREQARAAAGVDDVEHLFYISPARFIVERNITAPKGLLKPAEVAEIRALLKVLQAAIGDTISVNELKLLGLKNLAPVFTAAAGAA